MAKAKQYFVSVFWGLLCVACASASNSAAPVAPTVPGTVLAPESSEVTAELVEPVLVPMPDWALALPIDLGDRTEVGLPESLAFSEKFVDQGLHYEMSVSPEWTLVETGGFDQSPQVEWSLDDQELVWARTFSIPIVGFTFDEFVRDLGFTDDGFISSDTAVWMSVDSEDEGDFLRVRFFRYSVDRVAGVLLKYPAELGYEPLVSELVYLDSLTRTPYSADEEGSPSGAEVESLLDRFAPLAEDSGATPTCITNGLASDRINRYPDDIGRYSNVDRNDQDAVMSYLNLWADVEEVAAHCGLPPDSFGMFSGG